MITLRRATPEDREMLERWDRDPDVRASDPDDWWQWETELARSAPGVEMSTSGSASPPTAAKATAAR